MGPNHLRISVFIKWQTNPIYRTDYWWLPSSCALPIDCLQTRPKQMDQKSSLWEIDNQSSSKLRHRTSFRSAAHAKRYPQFVIIVVAKGTHVVVRWDLNETTMTMYQLFSVRSGSSRLQSDRHWPPTNIYTKATDCWSTIYDRPLLT